MRLRAWRRCLLVSVFFHVVFGYVGIGSSEGRQGVAEAIRGDEAMSNEYGYGYVMDAMFS
jgi:hypothetical protein